MARSYKRDSRGRFAGGGGGGDSRGPVKVGRSGPRGGKVGTRTEQRRNAAAQSARSAQFRGKTQANNARDAYKSAASAARAGGRKGGALTTTNKGAVKVNATPAAAGRKPRIADTLRATLRELAQSDARFYREIEQITGKPLRVQRSTPAPKPPRSNGGSQRGSVTNALRSNLRRLAQSDAARLREIADITKPGPNSAIGGSKGGKRKGVSGSSGKALPGSKPRKPRAPRKPKG